MSYLPGDFFVVRTGGWAAAVIRWGTRSEFNHAGIITDELGNTVEAQPHGAVRGNIASYDGDRLLYGSGIPLTSLQRGAVVAAAMSLVGTPYSWLDIVSLALLRWGIRFGPIRRRVERYDRLVCSELVDRADELVGIHLYSDGRPPCDVTPGDLGVLLLEQELVA
jgi:hypothetical protein